MLETQKPDDKKQEYQMEIRGCAECGSQFRTWVKSSQTFCSNLCRQESGLKNPKPQKKGPWESLELDQKKHGVGVLTKPLEPFVASDVKPKPVPTTVVVKPPTPVTTNEVKPPTSETPKPEVLTDEALDARWERYVASAKVFVTKMNRSRMEVAKLAIEACDIQWGGGNHWKKFEGVFTIKRFAEEVGINSKTLSEWCSIKRLIHDKLPEGVWSDSDFMAAYRSRKKVSRTSSPEEVAKIYTDELNRDQTNFYLFRGLSRLKTTRHLIFKKANLNDLDIEELTEMRDICREIDQKITEHLASRK